MLVWRTTRCLLIAGTVAPQRGEELFRALLSIQQTVLGQDNRVTLQTRHSLAVLLYERGDLLGARDEYRILLDTQRTLFGNDDRDTLRTRSTLALLLHDLQDLDGAVEESEAVLTLQRRLFGDTDRDTLLTWDRFALVLTRSNRLAEARQQFDRILDLRNEAFGGDDRETLITRHGIATLLRRSTTWRVSRTNSKPCSRPAGGFSARTTGTPCVRSSTCSVCSRSAGISTTPGWDSRNCWRRSDGRSATRTGIRG
jgi:hypothetical protein